MRYLRKEDGGVLAPTVEPRETRLQMFDLYSAEVETLELIAAFIRRVLPDVVIECGSYVGIGAVHFAAALHENGFGHLYTIEKDAALATKTEERLSLEGLQHMATVLHGDSVSVPLPVDSCDIVFHDADRTYETQRKEFERFLPMLTPGGLAFVHDSSVYDGDPAYRVREHCAEMARKFDMAHMTIASSRGLEIMQRRP